MRKIAFSLALAATAVSAPALASTESSSFKHEGVEYSYAVKNVGSKKIVTGTSSNGEPFRLMITDTRVRGTYNGRPVSFSRENVEPLGSVVVAQR